MLLKINGEIYKIENFDDFPDEDKEEIKHILTIANFTLDSVTSNGVFLERGQVIQAYIDTLADKGLNVKFITLDVFDLEVGDK